MSFTEDFTEFLDTNDFAVSAIVRPKTDKAATVSIIFDQEYLELLIGDSGHASSSPLALISDVDIDTNGVMLNNLITINSKDYAIINIQPDGTGLSILRLEDG